MSTKITLKSHLGNKTLIVSKDFLENGKNKAIIDATLKEEVEIALLIVKASSVRDVASEIGFMDNELTKAFSIFESRLSIHINPAHGNMAEVFEAYRFIDGILIDLANYFISNGLVAKGLYFSYTKNVYPALGENRTTTYEQSKHLIEFRSGQVVSASQVVASKVDGSILTLEYSDIDDVNFGTSVHLHNCYVGSIMELSKLNKSNLHKTLFQNTIVAILKEFEGSAMINAYAKKHESVTEPLKHFVKVTISTIKSVYNSQVTNSNLAQK